MNKDCTDWTIVNRSNGITYKFNAKEKWSNYCSCR